MKAIITVIGKDKIGILAKISTLCAENNMNIEDVNQNIVQGMFAMTMVVDLALCAADIDALSTLFEAEGKAFGLDVRMIQVDVYDAMYRI